MTGRSSEDRIGLWAIGLGAAAALAAGVHQLLLGAAVAAGAGLSVLNYAWLRAGARAWLASAARQQVAIGDSLRWGMVRFMMRFALLGFCLYAILISHLLPISGVVAGLFTVPAAAVCEGLRLLRADW